MKHILDSIIIVGIVMMSLIFIITVIDIVVSFAPLWEQIAFWVLFLLVALAIAVKLIFKNA